MSVSASNQAAIERILDLLFQNSKGLLAAVVATTDGMSIASHSRQESFDHSKLAAIASSIGAIGAVVGDETALGACKLVMVQSEKGYTVIVEAPHPESPMILSVVSDASAVLGQIIYAAREAASAIAQLGQ
jgi:uncharacterized protein